MTIVNDIITDALEIVGLKSPDEDLESSWAKIGLRRINSIFDLWNVSKIKGYSVVEQNFTLVSGQKTYTIGTGGDFNTNRPVKITNAFVFDTGGVSYPLVLVNYQDFDSIIYPEATNSFPTVMFYNPKYPLGEMSFYPTPSANYSIHFDCFFGFADYDDGSETVDLPQGYERLLTYQLAVDLCSHRGKIVPMEVKKSLKEVEHSIDAINYSTWMPSTQISTPTNVKSYGDIRTFLSRGI